MTCKKISICAISMLLLAGFSQVTVAADPVDFSSLDSAALRALFHSPAYNTVGPLDVYSEDYTVTGTTVDAALAHSPAHPTSTDRSATSAMREMLRNAEFVSSDGLDVYGGDFVVASMQ